MFQAITLAFSRDISTSKVRKLSWALQPKKKLNFPISSFWEQVVTFFSLLRNKICVHLQLPAFYINFSQLKYFSVLLFQFSKEYSQDSYFCLQSEALSWYKN